MAQECKIVSKVLVYDPDLDACETLRGFCQDHGLLGLRAVGDVVSDLVKSNVELGAIFLSEEPDEQGRSGIDLAVDVNKLRTEIPIFLRRKEKSDLSDLTLHQQRVLAGAYNIQDLSLLKEHVDTFLFNQQFPSEMVRGIVELTTESLQSSFPEMEVISENPYVVRDKIIFGKVFSLMHLEANWCRGYMMFQADEDEILAIARAGKTSHAEKDLTFRFANVLLSELSNVTWGKFKSRFIASELTNDAEHKIQVPIIVNHSRNYISFGSDDPLLCFKYLLQDPSGVAPSVTFLQKFIFSLSWRPDEFAANLDKLDEYLDGGELEMF